MKKYNVGILDEIEQVVREHGLNEVGHNSEKYGFQDFEAKEILYNLGYSKNNGSWMVFPFVYFVSGKSSMEPAPLK